MSYLDQLKVLGTAPLGGDKGAKSPFVTYVTPRKDRLKNRKRGSHPGDFQRILLQFEFTEPELREMAGDDWPAMLEDLHLAEVFADAARTRLTREACEVPPSYASTTNCRKCGPVPIWLECPPAVENCPWCFSRLAGESVPSTPYAA